MRCLNRSPMSAHEDREAARDGFGPSPTPMTASGHRTSLTMMRPSIPAIPTVCAGSGGAQILPDSRRSAGFCRS